MHIASLWRHCSRTPRAGADRPCREIDSPIDADRGRPTRRSGRCAALSISRAARSPVVVALEPKIPIYKGFAMLSCYDTRRKRGY
jgi:hypothetical protein